MQFANTDFANMNFLKLLVIGTPLAVHPYSVSLQKSCLPGLVHPHTSSVEVGR